MADFSITVTNSILVFGIEGTENWGAMTWGVDKWAFGTEDLPTSYTKNLDSSPTSSDSAQFFNSKKVLDSTQVSDSVQLFSSLKVLDNSQASDSVQLFTTLKVVSNGQASDSVQYFIFIKVIDNTQAVATEQARQASIGIDNTVAFTGYTSSEYLGDGKGYIYMFGTNSNAANRHPVTWSEQTYDTATYTTATRPTTVWT